MSQHIIPRIPVGRSLCQIGENFINLIITARNEVGAR